MFSVEEEDDDDISLDGNIHDLYNAPEPGFLNRRASLQDNVQPSRGRIWSETGPPSRRPSLQDAAHQPSRPRIWSAEGGASRAPVDTSGFVQSRRASLQEQGPKQEGFGIGRRSSLQENTPSLQKAYSTESRALSMIKQKENKQNYIVEDDSSSRQQHYDYSDSHNRVDDDDESDDTDDEWGVYQTEGNWNGKGVTWEDDNEYDESETTNRSHPEDDFEPTEHSLRTETEHSENFDGRGSHLEDSRWWVLWYLRLFPCCPRPPTMNSVALGVALYAPCFCCMGFKQRTDRALLSRLNGLMAFFSLVLLSGAVFLVTVLLNGARHIAMDVNSFFTPVVWNLNGQMFLVGLMSAILFVSAILTWRVVRDVNLLGAVRYLWVLLWIAPFILYCAVGLFDYFGVTRVYVKHWWRSFQMSWFRDVFCEEGTSETLCTVPISLNETGWCIENYNSTNCTEIRDDAQKGTTKLLLIVYYFSAGWSLLVLFLLVLATDTLERIITRPVVMKSKQYNVPAWLALPTIACTALGVFFTFSEWSSLNANSADRGVKWIGPLYLATGTMCFLSIILGSYSSNASILSTNDKRKKVVAVTCFTFCMTAALLMLIALFISCIYFSVAVGNLHLGPGQRGNLACIYDQFDSCTNCDAKFDRCPQWTVDDVRSVLQTQIKGSAAVAAVFILHSFSVLRYAVTLRKHIATYQIAFV